MHVGLHFALWGSDVGTLAISSASTVLCGIVLFYVQRFVSGQDKTQERLAKCELEIAVIKEHFGM